MALFGLWSSRSGVRSTFGAMPGVTVTISFPDLLTEFFRE